MKFTLVLSLFFISFGNYDALFSDEENVNLPKLFHVDDQDRCLLQTGGLYCLGEFDLMPIGNSPVYENIKKYSTSEVVFNRSRLYRGYCVSERCPLPTKKFNRTIAVATDCNPSQRFEQCVQQRARRYALTARLRTLKYCTTHEEYKQKMAQPPDATQKLFMQVVYAILALNIVGTVYDIFTNDDNKIGLITAWSIRSSWRRLTATYDNGDPRLKQLEGFHGVRVTIMMLIVLCHTWFHHFQFHVTNPQALEYISESPMGIVSKNGTSAVQLFILISNFLTAYHFLIYSEKYKPSLMYLPLILIKRIIRIMPVHLLVVGFASTYWHTMTNGYVSSVIEDMGTTCRQKFWTHALFLNNIVDKEKLCLNPTWYLPVDMHQFALSCTLSIMMHGRRKLAMRLYAILFVLSSAFCSLIAYLNGWKTIAAIAVPDAVRGLLVSDTSFTTFYTSTWGSLPACFLGLFLGHLHYELQQLKFDWNKMKWLKWLIALTIPMSFLYAYVMAITLVRYNQPWAASLSVALERPLFVLAWSAAIIGIINTDNALRRFYSWRGWRIPARLSLPMMLCHWIVSMVIVGRPVTHYISFFNVTNDYLVTLFYSYLISIPIALLVELPVQRFFNQLF